jgi:succinyl-diaminopimelate desuccinylase
MTEGTIAPVKNTAENPADRLAARTLELVDIPSVSREEAEIVAHAAKLVPAPFELLHEREDCLYFALPRRDGRPLVVLAGHLDTVPEQDNLPGRLEDGVVHGLGASDMKGGTAVMIELARWIAEDSPELAVDLGLVLFGKEELSMEESPLPELFEAVDDVTSADLAVVLEPTDGLLHVGCLGHLRALVVYDGVAGHSARPWLAENAIGTAIEGLQPLVELEPRRVQLGGVEFVEVVSPTQINGGVATNVIPDRVEVTLSFRYAPDRSPEDAERFLRGLVEEHGRIEELANSPAARVVVDTPLVSRLREAGELDIAPKQAWTPVAEFSLRGVDAVNFGPGATSYAHKRDEQVEVASLVSNFETLRRFLTA